MEEKRKKLSILGLHEMKKRGEKITWITAYDYPTAQFAEAAGMEMILVGDSLGMCVYGYEGTVPVTMDQCIVHSEAVRRGAPNTFVMGDMPFLSYQASADDAVLNAGRFLKEAGMDAVKLEGGSERCENIRKIVEAGIPVMGHLGLTPQSVNQLGGYRAQGKSLDSAVRLIEDAERIQEAGCFSIVLESIPDRLAELITQRLDIPTIGIGAGVGCDGQVLVAHDVLGMYDKFSPKFSKRYKNLLKEMENGFHNYIEEVQEKSFPSDAHVFKIQDDVWEQLLKKIRS